MKKLLFVVLLVFSLLTLAACDKDKKSVKILNKAIEETSISNANQVTSNITLKTSTNVLYEKKDYTIAINWKSSNTAVITNDGVITRQEVENTDVILRATFTYNNVSLTNLYIVKVLKAEEPEEPKEPEVIEDKTITEALQLTPNTKLNLVDVGVTLVAKRGFYVTDNIKTIYVYTGSAPSVTVGQKVTLKSATFDLYFEMPQLKNATVETNGEYGQITHTPNEISVTEFVALDHTNVEIYTYYNLKGTLKIENGDYKLITVNGNVTKSVEIYYASNGLDLLDQYAGKEVIVDVMMYNYHSKDEFYRVMFFGTTQNIREVPNA